MWRAGTWREAGIPVTRRWQAELTHVHTKRGSAHSGPLWGVEGLWRGCVKICIGLVRYLRLKQAGRESWNVVRVGDMVVGCAVSWEAAVPVGGRQNYVPLKARDHEAVMLVCGLRWEVG